MYVCLLTALSVQPQSSLFYHICILHMHLFKFGVHKISLMAEKNGSERFMPLIVIAVLRK